MGIIAIPQKKNARKDFFSVYFYKLSKSSGFKRWGESVPRMTSEEKDVLEPVPGKTSGCAFSGLPGRTKECTEIV